MKKITLPVLLLVMAATACKKENTAPQQNIPPAQITYRVNDTMQLSTIIQNNFPTFYNDFHNKTYQLTGTKLDGLATITGDGLLLTFADSTITDYESRVVITFKNKTTANITGNYNLFQNNDICVTWVQNLGRNKWVSVPSCTNGLSGSIDIRYNTSTGTFSGEIKNLRYPFGSYIPSFLSGSPHNDSQSVMLMSSGSTRTQQISFQYLPLL
jgi:hypothetical protein